MRKRKNSSKKRVSRQQAMYAVLRTSLLAFLQLAFYKLHREPLKLTWSIEALIHALSETIHGKHKRFVANLPPRHLKSFICSVVLPAFLLGQDSSLKIMVATYAEGLGVKHSNDFRKIIDSDWYRDLFPVTVTGRKNSQIEFETSNGGYRMMTSVSGPMTGRGADVLIIDDAIKATDARSDIKRAACLEWFTAAAATRLEDKANSIIIVAQQRLHVDDLSGHLLSSPRWHRLVIPAIAETDEEIQLGNGRTHFRKEGDVINPERESRETLDLIKEELGSLNFAAQYQQRPQTLEGSTIRRVWIRRYDPSDLGDPRRRRIVQSWDTASKGSPDNDYSVCVTACIQDRRFYILDVYRAKRAYPDLKRKVRELARLHRPSRILIEDTGVGTALIDELKAEGTFLINRVKPTKSKVERFSVASDKIEIGALFLPYQASWLETFEAEIFSFPASKHDDQVDALSQLLSNALTLYDPTMGMGQRRVKESTTPPNIIRWPPAHW